MARTQGGYSHYDKHLKGQEDTQQSRPVNERTQLLCEASGTFAMFGSTMGGNVKVGA